MKAVFLGEHGDDLNGFLIPVEKIVVLKNVVVNRNDEKQLVATITIWVADGLKDSYSFSWVLKEPEYETFEEKYFFNIFTRQKKKLITYAPAIYKDTDGYRAAQKCYTDIANAIKF